ncbi:uncharacterized protein CFP56_000993 [Quercus suber]|uniref:DUF4283 domain-containing protein n=1 Tax=Quercus suber TaxID=58331 RepID=A0AAW0LHN4_QUESU
MADDVTRIMEKMKLTVEEEEVIEIPEEGRKEGMESCALSLIGKFLTCRSFNRKAAITTLKRAWGLEEGVQMIEVGTNLFQLKFQTEFEMDRVFKGGPWSFDNQVLLLVRWKAGMTADNVRFDLVSLWVQIWGTPFDMVSPKIAETVGSRLGSVVEVEKKQRLEGQSYFMRVKVAIPLAKPIRRGAFLAGTDGKRHWVTFKYERLPLFCHFCGLLGHDLKHCAAYFVATKNEGDVICQYGDWMKATGGRNRSPSRRTFDREDAGVEFGWRKDQSGKVSQEASGDGGVAVQNPRDQDRRCKKGNCDKQGTVLEGAHVATDIKGCVETFTEDMGSAVAAVQNSNKGVVVEVDDSMHGLPMDLGCGPQSPKQKATWTRLKRMEIGPVEFFKEGAKSVLGKRINIDTESSAVHAEQHAVVKRVKSSGDSNSEETAGVPMHPCRTQ